MNKSGIVLALIALMSSYALIAAAQNTSEDDYSSSKAKVQFCNVTSSAIVTKVFSLEGRDVDLVTKMARADARQSASLLSEEGFNFSWLLGEIYVEHFMEALKPQLNGNNDSREVVISDITKHVSRWCDRHVSKLYWQRDINTWRDEFTKSIAESWPSLEVYIQETIKPIPSLDDRLNRSKKALDCAGFLTAQNQNLANSISVDEQKKKDTIAFMKRIILKHRNYILAESLYTGFSRKDVNDAIREVSDAYFKEIPKNNQDDAKKKTLSCASIFEFNAGTF
ncbi:hypothetical protein [Cellvibrio sp.]|uniref:hypothetical protein n=1 Tax=Cellvibrio sp. TaxID=1965322 RepID=UPI00396475B1